MQTNCKKYLFPSGSLMKSPTVLPVVLLSNTTLQLDKAIYNQSASNMLLNSLSCFCYWLHHITSQHVWDIYQTKEAGNSNDIWKQIKVYLRSVCLYHACLFSLVFPVVLPFIVFTSYNSLPPFQSLSQSLFDSVAISSKQPVKNPISLHFSIIKSSVRLKQSWTDMLFPPRCLINRQ